MTNSSVANTSSNALKGARRRIRIWMIVLVCFMGWAFMTLMDQMERLDTKMGKLHMIEQQYEDVQRVNAELQLEKQRLGDPEYIEQILKGDYHMTKDGETLYIETK